MILTGDCIQKLSMLQDESVQTCVTSPPYWGLRDYGVTGQIGLEPTIDLYVARMVEVFREVRRVLRNDGTLWLNLGDSYATGGGKANVPGGGYRGAHSGDAKRPKWAGPFQQPNRMPQPGLKPKDLCMIPARVALALQADGWYLRSDIVWHKPNPMPESVKDRPTKSHEYLFLLSKSARYYYNAAAVLEPTLSLNSSHKSFRPNSARIAAVGRKEFSGKHEISARSYKPEGRNRRTVWTVTTRPFKGAHFATFPPKLIEPCILAGSRPGDVVLDPFGGAMTTAMVAQEHGRRWIAIELNPKYVKIGKDRLAVIETKKQTAA